MGFDKLSRNEKNCIAIKHQTPTASVRGGNSPVKKSGFRLRLMTQYKQEKLESQQRILRTARE
jgi:hypothetical protein